MRCSFCDRSPAVATSKNGRVGCCGECASAGGPAADLVAEAADHGTGAKPMVVPSKLDKLLASQRGDARLSLAGAVARSAGRVIPNTDLQRKAREVRARANREHRQLVGAELSLSLAACAEASRAATRQAARAPKAVGGKRGIVEAVKRAGLRA